MPKRPSRGGGNRTGVRKHPGDSMLRGTYKNNKAAILNFHGPALVKTTRKQQEILHHDFINKETNQSVLKSYYEDQDKIADEDIGGPDDSVWRNAITSQAVVSLVLRLSPKDAALN